MNLETMNSENNKRSARSSPKDDSLIRVGMRIEERFKNGEWHDVGAIDKITRGKDGKIIKVVISFDIGIKEERDWPHKDIAVIVGKGNAEEEMKEKRSRSVAEEEKKDGKRRKVIVDEGGPKMFKCGEEGCEYEARRADSLKRHRAAIHDIDVTYYL